MEWIKIVNFMIVFTFMSSCMQCLQAKEISPGHGVKYVLQVNKNSIDTVIRDLPALNLTLRNKITRTTFIVEYTGFKTEPALRRILSNMKTELHSKKILAIERNREYADTLRPVTSNAGKENQPDKIFYPPNLVCDHYYGMGVHDTWSRGYTGKGVTIGIPDVGVNMELLDLKSNLDENLSYNFVNGSHNVSSEYFPNYQDTISEYTDHGNKVASVIAATKGNGICSAGIAHNATIAALKVFIVKLSKHFTPELYPSHWTQADVIARALSKWDIIDIFACAWAPTQPFDKLDLATRNAISEGAEYGRRGLGSVYVVPSGPPGNELSNNIHTITVNSIGQFGTIPDYAYIDASVLTSGLGDGNNLSATSMVTTTRGDACITGFKGVSAATAQTSGIFALALEANPNLSLRDIQHLLVHASDYEQLKEKIAFTSNAAGHYFHGVFGFGLLNADKLVTLANIKRPTHKLRTKTLRPFTKRSQKLTHTFELCNSCDKFKTQKCLTTLEHVTVQMDITARARVIKIALDSPNGTRSVLMDFKVKKNKPVSVRKLKLVTVHFWDEMPFGIWRLYVQDKNDASHIQVTHVSLTIQGTSDPEKTKFGDECLANTDDGKDVTTTIPTSSETTELAPTEARNDNISSGNVLKTALEIFSVFLMVLVLVVVLVFVFIRCSCEHSSHARQNTSSANLGFDHIDIRED